MYLGSVQMYFLSCHLTQILYHSLLKGHECNKDLYEEATF